MSLEDVNAEDRELAKLMRQLSNDPSTRDDALRLTRRVRPDLPIPELDIQDRVSQATSVIQAKLDAREAKDRERDAREELNRRRSSLKSKGFASSDEDIGEIEKIMIEKGITNHESAAEYHKFIKQAAVPTPSGYNPNPMKAFDLSAFRKNPVMAARETAMQALQEIRRPMRPIGL